MLSFSICAMIMISSTNMGSYLPVRLDYEHQVMTDDGLDRTNWLPEVVVTAEPFAASTPDVPRVAGLVDGADNTYWLPEVVITAEPIRDPEPTSTPGTILPAQNRLASTVVAGVLALFSTLLGLGLLSRPELPPGTRLQPARVKPSKHHRRRRSTRRLRVNR